MSIFFLYFDYFTQSFKFTKYLSLLNRMKSYCIGLIFLMLASCNFLDTTPENLYTEQKALQTSQGIRQAMIGIYDGLQHRDLYGGNLQLIGELMAGHLEKSGKNTIPEGYEAFYNHQISPHNPIVLGLWKQGYQVIAQTNQILQNLHAISNTEERKQIEGECLFVRGLIHFELGRYFSSLDSGLAVPYVTEMAENSKFLPTRDSISSFYAKILTDFEASKNLLLGQPILSGRANYWAVEAMLARLYFYQKNHEKAFFHADNVLENSPFILNENIQEIFSNSIDSEAIFRLQSTQNDNSGQFLNEFYNLGKIQGGSFSVSPIFRAILDRDLNDTRRFVFHQFEGGKVFVRKFDDKNLAQGVSLPIIRLAEMYLIRAEIQVQNQADKEIIRSDYNALRLRAGLPADRATSSPVALLRTIEEERLKELAWEGDIFHHKKRKNENFGTLAAHDARLVLPIPARELELNPNLVQNIGY